MRPKSNATVVVDLVRTRLASSIPTLASVMISSVLSGRISLTEPTIVVLPTPNPPTMTIFIASSVEAGSGSRAETSSVAEGSEVVVSPEVVESSEVVESNEHLPQDVGIRLARPRAGRRVAYGDAA